MTAAAPPREVAAHLVVESDGPTEFVLAVSAADGVPLAGESLRVALDGAPVGTREIPDLHGTRLTLFLAGAGRLAIDYAATALGRAAAPRVEELDVITYVRPSRYVPADAMTDRARAEFAGLSGRDAVVAIERFVHESLEYRPAGPLRGGAVETLEAGAGVCRDFAHVALGFLRALDFPARFVAVYAPGLTPPDFHAVVEVLVEGRWEVIDPTRLAPRQDFVRIATGRDAADTAFLTNTLGDVRLLALDVRARAIAPSTDDDRSVRVELG